MRKSLTLVLAAVLVVLLAVPGNIATAREKENQLNLAEANVTRVDYSRSGTSGNYRFNVTLYHDDDGEDGYANWWQVETLDGEQLGRRKLLHAHGTREFTRSDTIKVPEGTRFIVVRGHDENHGYGGRAAIVDLNSGGIEFVDQGVGPRNFGKYAQTRQVEMTSYSNEELGFKISYPKGWEKVFPKEGKSREPEDRKEIFFRASSSKNLENGNSVSVMANELNQPVTLDEYEQYVKLSDKFFPPGFEEISRGELAGLPAVIAESTRVDYVSKTEAENGTDQTREKITRRVKTIGLITRGNLYRVTVSAAVEDFAEVNEKYFGRILDSFEILPE